MHVYFSTSPIGDVFGVANRKNWGQAELDTDAGVFPHWTWEDIQFGNWNEARTKEVNIEIPWVCQLSLDFAAVRLLRTRRLSERIFLHYGPMCS
jgi:hypothetical protein